MKYYMKLLLGILVLIFIATGIYLLNQENKNNLNSHDSGIESSVGIEDGIEEGIKGGTNDLHSQMEDVPRENQNVTSDNQKQLNELERDKIVAVSKEKLLDEKDAVNKLHDVLNLDNDFSFTGLDEEGGFVYSNESKTSTGRTYVINPYNGNVYDGISGITFI
jgi:hypothetical protein